MKPAPEMALSTLLYLLAAGSLGYALVFGFIPLTPVGMDAHTEFNNLLQQWWFGVELHLHNLGTSCILGYFRGN
jgi:hypothetical protein